MASVQPMFIADKWLGFLRFSEPGIGGRLVLGQIRQNAEAKTEIGPPLSDRALHFDKARSFNQSERVLYRNFIINICKKRIKRSFSSQSMLKVC